VETKNAFTQGATGVQAHQRVQAQIAALGLTQNVADLESDGYTVVENAAPIEMFDRIREAILEVTEQTLASGVEPFNFGPNTSMMYRLLAKHDVFAEAVLTPKLSALTSYLLGEGYVISVATGSVLHKDSNVGPLHADNQFYPHPFPPHFLGATAIWCCDDFNGENGSTHIVPGSHRYYRHPKPGEGVDQAVPVVAPKGSIVIWTAHTWHRSGGRTVAGERVALHTGFVRPHLRVFEAYQPDEIERLVARDERFRRLVGADLPYDYTDSPDAMKIIGLAMTTQALA